MKKNTVFLLVYLATKLLAAQSPVLSLISPGGDMTQTGSLTLSYSIGEPCISYTLGDLNWLTEGFQQPEKIVLTSVEIHSLSEFSFRIFPNPAESELQIVSTDPAPWRLTQITNLLGQSLLFEPIVAADKMIIDITLLSPGMYLLHILDHSSSPAVQSFIKI